MTKAGDILAYQQQVGAWVDWDNTPDRIVVGSAEVQVTDAAVAWIATCEALREAASMGCQLFITHEPTFYVQDEELWGVDTWPEDAAAKKRFIEEQGLTVLRFHDTWDGMPEVGIPWAWAKFLGFENEPLAQTLHLQVRPVEEMTLEALARHVASRTSALGEPAVQVVGDPQMRVSKIGTGTGCYSNPEEYCRLGADAGILCDDGTSYWSNGLWGEDNSFGIVRVNHGTVEEPGVAALAPHLAEKFPDVTFHHIPQGCRFRFVSAQV